MSKVEFFKTSLQTNLHYSIRFKYVNLRITKSMNEAGKLPELSMPEVCIRTGNSMDVQGMYRLYSENVPDKNQTEG